MSRPLTPPRFSSGFLAAVVLFCTPLAAQTTVNQFSLGTDVQPLEIAAGPDGNLWFVVFGDGSAGASKVGRITTAGVVTELVLPDSSRPVGIVAGPDGAMWFTESGNSTSSVAIGRINTGTFPSGASVTHFTAGITPGAFPFGICVGPDGNLWFAERNNKAIARITTSGVVTEFPIGPPKATPLGIVAGPDGNLWFSDRSDPDFGTNSSIGVMSTAGSVVKRISTPTAAGNPTGITVGPDGRIWFVEFDGSMIGVLATTAIVPGDVTEYPTPTATPYRIVTGPDGNLWFTENGNGTGTKIAKITTSGTITETTVLAGPYGIAVGPDRALWFTEGYQFGPAGIGQLLVDCVVNRPVIASGGTWCEATPFTLTASAGWASYQWYRGGSLIPGATSATYSKTAALSDAGSYTVAGTNGTCTSNPSDPAVVAIRSQPVASAGGPQTICNLGTSQPLGGNTPAAGSGAWTVVSGGTGFFTPGAASPSATFTHTGGAGPIVLAWTVSNAPCTPSSANVTLTIGSNQTIPVTAPANVCVSSNSTASVPDGGAGATYSWTVTNGTIGGGQGTPTLQFASGPSGSTRLDVVRTSSGCTSSGTTTIPIDTGCIGPHAFFPVNPCRRIDTRLTAYAPILSPGEQRTLTLTVGPCAIPPAGRSVTANVTITGSTAAGVLKFFATGTAVPTSTAISFGANQTRANNAVIMLSSDGTGRVDVKNESTGSVHLIIDVNGYFN